MQPTQEYRAHDIKLRRVVTGHTADGQAGIASGRLISRQVWPRSVDVYKLWAPINQS